MRGRPEKDAAADVSDEDTVTRLKSFDDFDLRLGDVMRGERATLGKSLLDVQRDLKIKATYIAAIENADPSAFETPGFVAGYVRSYARYLGLDPEWAFQTFCEEGKFTVTTGIAKASKPSASVQKTSRSDAAKSGLRDPIAEPSVAFLPTTPSSLSTIEPRAIGSLLVLVLLVGGIGYGGWSVLREVQKVQFTPVEQAPGVASDLGNLPTGFDLTETAEADIPARPAPEALDRLYRPEALDIPVLVARDGPIGALNPAETGRFAPIDTAPEFAAVDTTPPAALDGTAELAEAEPLTVQVVEEGPPEVALLAVRPSWVRVTAADGTVIFEKILDAGERFTLPQTEEPPTLRAGNAGSLYFAIGSETFGPAGDGPAVIRNVSLGIDALVENYALANPDENEDLARFIAVAEASDASEPSE